jgi:hypothetical protein
LLTRRSPEPKPKTNGAWSVASFTDHRILRSLWLRLLSRAVDGHMKSPSFLLWMRYSIDVAIAVRRLQGARNPSSASMRHP